MIKSNDPTNKQGVNDKNAENSSDCANASDIVANGGFPHLMIVMLFCLCALIFHHAYNLEKLK